MPAAARGEVLRYLGYRGQEIDGGMLDRVDTAMEHCRKLARPRSASRQFPLGGDGQRFFDGDTGQALPDGLPPDFAGAAGITLFAATLGTEIEAAISRAQYSDMAYALMLDAAATQYIEEVCDAEQAGLDRKAAPQGLSLGTRFSPGYGDVPLSFSAEILRLLDAARAIGLSHSASFALTPRKSVTAIIPVFQRRQGQNQRQHKCASCRLCGKCGFQQNWRDDEHT